MRLKYRGVEYQSKIYPFVTNTSQVIGKYRGAVLYARKKVLPKFPDFHITVVNLRYRGIDHLGSGYRCSENSRELQIR